jgi:uncharacterized protein YjbI with pentapeptide repeats
LSGIGLGGNNLAGGNFAGQNLANVYFNYATLTGADFREANLTNANFFAARLAGADLTGAEVRGAEFYRDSYNNSASGISLAQLYSTASYQVHDLRGIGVGGNNLAGGNFAGQNLTNASLGATLTGADFTSADTRGAQYLNLFGATTTNLILPSGHIDGLNLHAGGLLVVRDYDGNSRYQPALPPIPITVDQHLTMGPGATLRMVFEADAWDSTISFAPGIPVTLGGTLELTFTDDVNLASQVGRTLKIFDWAGVSPTGALNVISPYAWELSTLFTTGEITLISVPEPRALSLLSFALCALVAMRHGPIPLTSVRGEYP